MQQTHAPASRQELVAVTVGVILVLAVIVYFGFRGSSDTKSTDADRTVAEQQFESLPTLPVREVMERFFAKSALFVDIRPAARYTEAHIPGSRSVPFESLAAFTPPRDTSIIIVWSRSDRELALAALQELRSKNVPFVFIEGGIEGWINGAGTIVTAGNPALFTDQSKVTLINAEKFKTLTEDSNVIPLIIDVRGKEAYNQSHIVNAVNIPLADLETRYDEIPSTTSLFVYGGTDLESFQAAVRLFDLNFFSVRALQNGFSEWEKKGYPVESTQK